MKREAQDPSTDVDREAGCDDTSPDGFPIGDPVVETTDTEPDPPINGGSSSN